MTELLTDSSLYFIDSVGNQLINPTGIGQVGDGRVADGWITAEQNMSLD